MRGKLEWRSYKDPRKKSNEKMIAQQKLAGDCDYCADPKCGMSSFIEKTSLKSDSNGNT
jgi:hypothetical protein